MSVNLFQMRQSLPGVGRAFEGVLTAKVLSSPLVPTLQHTAAPFEYSSQIRGPVPCQDFDLGSSAHLKGPLKDEVVGSVTETTASGYRAVSNSTLTNWYRRLTSLFAVAFRNWWGRRFGDHRMHENSSNELQVIRTELRRNFSRPTRQCTDS